MTLLGAHTRLGSRNGYGEFVSARPRVVLSVDDGGALLEAKEKSGGHTVTIFRDTTVYLEAPGDLYNLPAGVSMADVARYWYAEHNNGGLWRKFQENPADYYCITNEQGGNNPDHIAILVDYEREVMKLMNADGFKACVLNLAGGSPGDFDVWAELCAGFIAEAWESGNIYGRHVYGGGDLVDMRGVELPGQPVRPLNELWHLSNNLGARGGLAITECGLDGGFGYAGDDRFVYQMTAYAEALWPFSDSIIGICMWDLSSDGRFDNANWQSAIPRFVDYMIANPSPPWKSPADPEIEDTLEEVLWDASVVEQIENGLVINTNAGLLKQIISDGLIPVHNEIIEEYNGERYTLQAAEHPQASVPRRVYVWQSGQPIWSFEDPDNELEAFVISTYPVRDRVPFVTSPFNAPRSYGPHEGVDLRVSDSSGQMPFIVAGQDGIVESIRRTDPGTGYGIYVRLRHEGFEPGIVWKTWYGHLSSVMPDLVEGQFVGEGARLGIAGSTGNSTGPHLHVTVQRIPGGLSGYSVDSVVDPAPLIPALQDTPPPPNNPKIDMAKYFLPHDGLEFGHIYILRNNWGAGDERLQLQRDGDFSYVTKNQNWEQRRIGPDYIDLVMDTSPAPGEFYTVQGHWLPREMEVGEIFDKNEHVEWFFDNCAPNPSKPPGDSHTQMQLVGHHDIFSGPDGVPFNDVIELNWLVGGLVDETYWFAAHYGLIQWRKNNARGDMSWVREKVPDGTQGNNARKQINCTPFNGGSEEEVLGVDVSHWQGVMDWETARASGIRYAFIKATEGTTFVDSALDANVRGAIDAGLFVSMYHFYRPNADPLQQAKFFAEKFNFYVNILPAAALPILDLEAAPTNTTTYQQDLLAFIEHIEVMTDRVPMIYTRAGFYDPYLQGIGLEQYPLWIAHYTTRGQPLLPSGVSNWEFWQWTSDGDGATHGASSQFIDLNRFNGTLAEFEAAYPISPLPEKDCAGTPPTPYSAVRYWVSSTASCETQLKVFALAMGRGVTFCWSADEALQGNLEDKLAVFWNLSPTEQQEMGAWAAENYPEARVEFQSIF